jgi:putrescine aminotransferase
VPYGDLEALQKTVNEFTAAVILEPIQGEGGIIEPPAGYLKAVEKLCHERGALFIADEVQTGIGRTGAWFGVNQDGAEPDLMAVAKALGGGVMPVGSVIGTEQAWQGLIENPFLHTSTFGGGQMACAAGLATLQVIEEEDLLARGKATGAYFKKGLQELQRDFPQVIKDVRGRGMMLGMELTREGAGGMLMALMIARHIIIAYTLNNPKVIRFEPPLCMPTTVVDLVLTQLREALQEVAAAIDDL